MKGSEYYDRDGKEFRKTGQRGASLGSAHKYLIYAKRPSRKIMGLKIWKIRKGKHNK